MILQTARFLLKQYAEAKSGATADELPGLAKYMAVFADPSFHPESARPRSATSVDDFFDLDYLRSLFEYRALVFVSQAAEMVNRLTSGSGSTPPMSVNDARNRSAIKLTQAATAHVYFFCLNNFIDTIRTTSRTTDSAHIQGVIDALSRLAALFAVSNIVDGHGQQAQFTGIMSQQEMPLVEEAAATLVEQLRPDAIALVDAFDLPDRVLNSTIGRYDGNVYEALYEQAKR
jgi:acyl-CoA oxidase